MSLAVPRDYLSIVTAQARTDGRSSSTALQQQQLQQYRCSDHNSGIVSPTFYREGDLQYVIRVQELATVYLRASDIQSTPFLVVCRGILIFSPPHRYLHLADAVNIVLFFVATISPLFFAQPVLPSYSEYTTVLHCCALLRPCYVCAAPVVCLARTATSRLRVPLPVLPSVPTIDTCPRLAITYDMYAFPPPLVAQISRFSTRTPRGKYRRNTCETWMTRLEPSVRRDHPTPIPWYNPPMEVLQRNHP